jgi:hypothetical protein
MKSTPRFPRVHHGKIAAIFALLTILVFISSRAEAQCSIGTCQTEIIEGTERFGYWSGEAGEGYYHDTSHWDYSDENNGHWVTLYNPTYDVDGNFLYEEPYDVWVIDPVWVESQEWLSSRVWLDCDHMAQSETTEHSVILDITIREDNVSENWRSFICGKKVYSSVSWIVDESSQTILPNSIIEDSRIFETNNDPSLTVGGYANVHSNLSANQTSIVIFSGTAWTQADPLQFVNSVLPDSLADLNPFNIDWTLEVDLETSGSGLITGRHNDFPSYLVQVDGASVYDYVQPHGGVIGILALAVRVGVFTVF